MYGTSLNTWKYGFSRHHASQHSGAAKYPGCHEDPMGDVDDPFIMWAVYGSQPPLVDDFEDYTERLWLLGITG